MIEPIEQDPLRRGQLLNDIKNSGGWALLQEMLTDIYEAAVKEALDPDITDTAVILHRRAKANAIREIHVNLVSRVEEEIQTALQQLSQ